jgi:hypothetical protein
VQRRDFAGYMKTVEVGKVREVEGAHSRHNGSESVP